MAKLFVRLSGLNNHFLEIELENDKVFITTIHNSRNGYEEKSKIQTTDVELVSLAYNILKLVKS
jgi:type VI protein secretion system component Hcp